MIGKIIYSILSQDAGYTALASTRIYPEIAAQNAALPLAVFTVIDTTPADTKDNVSCVDNVRVQIDCYSNTYMSKETLAEAVKAALNRAEGTTAGIGDYKITLLDSQDGFIENTDRFRKILDFNVRIIPA